MQLLTAQSMRDDRGAIPLERLDQLDYVAHEYELTEVAGRLARQGYRGAICGPEGSGKSTLLQALGDELLSHGYSPLSLRVDAEHSHGLPKRWLRTIRKARPTDALLLDGYDLLPRRSRLWVWAISKRAGAVVVTSKKDGCFKTLARMQPTVALLETLIDALAPAQGRHIDSDMLFDQSGGNLRTALESLCHRGMRSAPDQPRGLRRKLAG